MQERPIILPENVRREHAIIAQDYLVKAKKLRVEKQAPKIKAFRRKMAALKPKPVPDAGVIYEVAGTKYKVQPNGEWRRVKD